MRSELREHLPGRLGNLWRFLYCTRVLHWTLHSKSFFCEPLSCLKEEMGQNLRCRMVMLEIDAYVFLDLVWYLETS